MTEIIVAKSAGFCFGVQRAVDTVYSEIEKGERIYTFGPIIHNAEVVSDLEKRGVRVVEDLDTIKELDKGTVIIRSHGVSKEISDALNSSKLKVVDTTCPFVKKIHNIVERDSRLGKRIVVIGSRNHPEVMGIIGWCAPGNPAVVIETKDEANDFSADSECGITVVSQTTFTLAKFKELVEILRKKGYNVDVVNTICNATAQRQEEAQKIASEVDMMIVIGDSKSSNTQKLYEICSRECSNTLYVQTKDDLKTHPSGSLQRVGITAGASTPKKIIEEVQNYVRINF
ncbi:MAG: 4-hydroxy-3-methylbut-2-enyl diphosphate reductase [Lachnospiraceae bacterium]|nr:4-hydroxy-3-methylbut-2-enyl diphosphate reductase [Lachnospiraceae bacterium]